jgi:hypothetical protein
MFATQFNGLTENRSFIVLPTLSFNQVGQDFRVWLSGEVTPNGFRLGF